MSTDIAAKVIIVTGAASGIGRALAIGFAADGANVIGFDPDATGLEETKAMSDSSMQAVTGDVCSDADVVSLVEGAIGDHGRIDVLINNAGIANQGNLTERPFADWQAVIDVNVNGLARCIYYVLPHMQEQKYGRIINVCSREGETGRRTLSAYSASKAAVAAFTKSIARELDKNGFDDVIVSGLIPGGTRTNMNRNDEMQEPREVYPHTRFLVTLPRATPNGRVYFRSEDYEMFTLFNEQRARITPG